jgi:putative FmdB family regulatory protein
MPIYECRCEACELTFEVLAPLSASGMKGQRCPECGRHARRVISQVSFAINKNGDVPRDKVVAGRPDVTKLRVPPAARLCWMDDRSASRLAAYKHGRGAEYDDTVAGREELRKKRGVPENKPVPHSHHDSPLADATVYARRKEAARKAKIAESKAITDRRGPSA